VLELLYEDGMSPVDHEDEEIASVEAEAIIIKEQVVVIQPHVIEEAPLPEEVEKPGKKLKNGNAVAEGTTRSSTKRKRRKKKNFFFRCFQSNTSSP
jgi:hypothetical protein